LLGANGGPLDFINPLNLPTPAHTYTVLLFGGSLSQHVRLTGALSGQGNLALTGAISGVNTGMLELAADNSAFSGNVVLNATSGGHLMLGNANALPASAGLNFAGTSASNANTLILNDVTTDFTRAVGTGPGQVQWTGTGGFSAAGATRRVNLGGTATPALVQWGSGGFVPSGSALVLAAAGDSLIDFRNPIDLNNGNRTFLIGNGGTAELSGVLSNGSVT